KRLELVQEKLQKDPRLVSRQLSLEDERALQDAVLEYVNEHRQELQDIRGPNNRPFQGQSTGRVAYWFLLQGDEKRREEAQNSLVAHLSPPAQEYFESLPKRQQGRQLRTWLREATQPKLGPAELERFFTDELRPDQREQLLTMPQPQFEERLE